MTIDTQELRRLAEGAAPGPWRIEDDEDSATGAMFIASGLINYCGQYIARLSGIRDAEFIAAANPATVLTLLDTIDAQAREVEELRSMLERWLPFGRADAGGDIARFIVTDTEALLAKTGGVK
jgi:hypothetical protein